MSLSHLWCVFNKNIANILPPFFNIGQYIVLHRCCRTCWKNIYVIKYLKYSQYLSWRHFFHALIASNCFTCTWLDKLGPYLLNSHTCSLKHSHNHLFTISYHTTNSPNVSTKSLWIRAEIICFIRKYFGTDVTCWNSCVSRKHSLIKVYRVCIQSVLQIWNFVVMAL